MGTIIKNNSVEKQQQLKKKQTQYSKMSTCCCSSNVKAAKVWGIIFLILNILTCFGTNEKYGNLPNIIQGVAGALISCLLIFGAIKRSSTAILVWMILSVIEIIGYTIYGILLVMELASDRVHAEIEKLTEETGIDKETLKQWTVIVLVVSYIIYIFFTIWILIIAKRARKEIKEDQ